MICKHCGTDINTKIREADGSVVCPGCGTVYRPKSAPKPEQQPAAAPVAEQRPPRTENTHINSSQPRRAAKRSGTGVKAAIAIFAVVLVVGGTIGLILHNKVAEEKEVHIKKTDSLLSETQMSSSESSNSQNNENEEKLSDYEKLFKNGPLMAQSENGLWGYIDINGNWVIEPQYATTLDISSAIGDFEHLNESDLSACGIFRNGRAKIRDRNTGLFGFIDTTGNVVVAPHFSSLSNFSNGLAKVEDAETGLWGRIDETGAWVIEPKFLEISDFKEGLAAAQDPSTEKWGYINESGAWVIEPKFFKAYSFVNGIARVKDNDAAVYEQVPGHSSLYFTESLSGYIDKTGNYFIQPQYYNALNFHEGLAAVCDPTSKKWGYINETGVVVIPFSFEKASSFKEGRAFVGINTGDSYEMMINTDGVWLMDYPFGCYPCGYGTDEGGFYWHGDYLLIESTLNFGSRYVVNKNGTIVFDENADNITPREMLLQQDGLIKVVRRDTGKFGIYSIDNGWILDPIYSTIRAIPNTLIAKDEAGVSVFDFLGNSIPAYDSIFALSQWIEGEEKYGYVNGQGELRIDYCYDLASSFSDDLSFAFACINNYYGVIDNNGNWLISPEFKGFTANEVFHLFSNT